MAENSVHIAALDALDSDVRLLRFQLRSVSRRLSIVYASLESIAGGLDNLRTELENNPDMEETHESLSNFDIAELRDSLETLMRQLDRIEMGRVAEESDLHQ